MWPLVELAPMLVELPLQILAALATVADGNGLTVTLTESVFEHPEDVIVSFNL